MDGRAASHTITDKIPHLIQQGIEVVVISGVTGEHDKAFEHHQVWSWGPSGFKFELRHVLRQRLNSKLAYRMIMLLVSLVLLPFILVERLFKPVESSWSWVYGATHRGLQLARQKPFDLIYSTAGPFAAHLAAQTLKHRLNTPWLAEIHDPLVLPGTVPHTRRQKAYADVERRICHDADIAIWFTDQAMQSALQRHPVLANKGRVMLPGVDNPFHDAIPLYQPGPKLRLGHFGSLSNTRTLLPFIHAMALVKQQHPLAYADMEVHIYGGKLDEPSSLSAQNLQIQDCIKPHGRIETNPSTGMSGRDQVLMHMRQCDALLLVHGDDPMCAEYMPSKLYEYLWMQRPLLATAHDNPQMAALIRAEGHQVAECSIRHGGRSTDTAPQLKDMLLQLWQLWRTTGLPDSGRATPYTTQASTHQLLGWAQAIYHRAT
jgi:hypothetical protein